MIDFINNLGINSTSGLIGLGLALIGFFLILAGFGIISIEKITVQQGKITWIIGIILAAVGILLLIPEFGTSKPITALPTATAMSSSETLQTNQQTNYGTLKFDMISPPTVLENESRKYTLTGSGFCNDTVIFLSGYALVGNSPEAANSLPVEVSSDGTWLTVYINPGPAPDQSGVNITVENPDGNTSSLYVKYER